jgi:putative nucleotidyltransferase with HDIG domain
MADYNVSNLTSGSGAADDLGKAMSSLLRAFTLYPPTHPVIREASARLLAGLKGFFAESGQVIVGFLGEDLIVLARRLLRVEGSIQGLNQMFRQRGIEKITFFKGITQDELTQFFTLLGKTKVEPAREGEALVRQKDWPHIALSKFGTVGVVENLQDGKSPVSLNEAKLVKDYIEATKTLVSQIQSEKLVEYSLASEIIDNILNGMILENNTIPLVAQIKAHDPYTFTHILNVSTLCLAMGRILGFDPKQLREFGTAALLHDTGKSATPLEVLQKKGRLTDEEFNIMKMHPVHGASMLMKIKDVPELAPIVSYEHHIHLDGTGYPEIGRRRKPHLCSRICTIADVYDALRTIRPYRNEVSKVETLNTMGRMPLDPFLFNVFARIANLYEAGEYVRLDSDEIGVIHEVNPQDALRPKVKILFDAERNKLKDARIVNLTNWNRKAEEHVYSIVEVIPEEEIAKLA